jgi:alpha-D-xyloside xylohydrolase
MAGQIKGLLGYGLSGVPFCSHDAGGFDYPPHAFDEIRAKKLDSEMLLSKKLESYPRDMVTYVRWLQFGVFSSHLRIHGKGPHEPWEYGTEAEIIAHRYLKLRYRLLPYIYSSAVQSSQTGLPMVRPLVLEFQEDINVRQIDMQFLFGDDFLISLAGKPGQSFPIYLPKGDWIDYWSKIRLQGGVWLNINPEIDTLPIWIKRGAIIPMGPEMSFVYEKALDPLTLEIYYPYGKRTTTIFDEDKPDILVSYECHDDQILIQVSETPGDIKVFLYGISVTDALHNEHYLPIQKVESGSALSFSGRQASNLALKFSQ